MAIHELGRTTMWLFSFVNKLKNSTKGNDKLFFLKRDLFEILLNKYPNCCPACFGVEIALPIKNGVKSESWLDSWKGEIQPCSCLVRLSEVEVRNQQLKLEDKIYIKKKLREYAKKHVFSKRKNFSLSYFQDMYKEVFESNTFITSIESIGFHLLEEIGEIAESLSRIYTYENKKEVIFNLHELKLMNLENEIADAFSWIFTLSNKLRDTFSLADRTIKKVAPTLDRVISVNFENYALLTEIIWDTYGNNDIGVLGCRDESMNPICKCPIYLIYDNEKLAEHTLSLIHI